MNKSQIIQRLLEENHITVEEAMILMTSETIINSREFSPYSPPYKVGDYIHPNTPYFQQFYTTDTNIPDK